MPQELPDHPAMKKFNEPWEYVKHVGKKALRWAAKAAIIVGVAALVLSILPAGILGVANTLTFGLTGLLTGSGAGFAWGSLLGGVAAGAAVGGLLGGVSAVADAGDAVDERKEQAIAAYDRAEARAMRVNALELQAERQRIGMAQQAQGMGLSPQGLPNMGQNELGR